MYAQHDNGLEPGHVMRIQAMLSCRTLGSYFVVRDLSPKGQLE